MSIKEKIETYCENCGKKFKADFDELDKTVFVTMLHSNGDLKIRYYNFCSYKCELEFINKMKKIEPKLVKNWRKPTDEEKKECPRYYSDY